MTVTSPAELQARFASRIEAFSDLVFGFSLSLLAARLDVPPKTEGILDLAHFIPFLVTFVIISALWLEHYRVFRLGFVGRRIDIFTNFVFLFAIACLPYALQTFMRFIAEVASVELYLADLTLMFLALATLQLRSLLYGSLAADDAYRLTVWKRIVSKYVVSLIAIVVIVLLHFHLISVARFVPLFGPILGLLVIVVRAIVRRFVRVPARSPAIAPDVG